MRPILKSIEKELNLEKGGKKFKYVLTYDDTANNRECRYTTFSNNNEHGFASVPSTLNIIFTNKKFTEVIFGAVFNYHVNKWILNPLSIAVLDNSCSLTESINRAIQLLVGSDENLRFMLEEDVVIGYTINNMALDDASDDNIILSLNVVLNDDAFCKLRQIIYDNEEDLEDALYDVLTLHTNPISNNVHLAHAFTIDMINIDSDITALIRNHNYADVAFAESSHFRNNITGVYLAFNELEENNKTDEDENLIDVNLNIITHAKTGNQRLVIEPDGTTDVTYYTNIPRDIVSGLDILLLSNISAYRKKITSVLLEQFPDDDAKILSKYINDNTMISVDDSVITIDMVVTNLNVYLDLLNIYGARWINVD